MSDDKAAAAYHPGNAPETRPDLDTLIGTLRTIAAADYGKTGDVIFDAAAALAAERARADRARAVVAEMADDDDEYPLESWWRARILRALSADPTAEQGAGQ